jgi:hypothetical protein
LVKPKHVGAFIVNFNVNFNILKQFNCALVGRIKDLIHRDYFGANIRAVPLDLRRIDELMMLP